MPVPSPTYLLQNIYDDLEGRPSGRANLLCLVEQSTQCPGAGYDTA